jgi:ATP-dependent Clp protease protease subunit
MISNSERKGAQMSKKVDDFNAGDRIELKLLEHSVHYLFNEIDQTNTAECVKWIIYENLDPKEKVLTLYINSTGGDLYAALGLIDVIASSKHPVRIIGIGSVMSAAFLIFAAGTKGERFAAKNTSFMCHQFSSGGEAKYHDIKAEMKENESLNAKMVDILREATGLAPSVIKKKLLPASDVYLTADEAVELGIADHLL